MGFILIGKDIRMLENSYYYSLNYNDNSYSSVMKIFM